MPEHETLAEQLNLSALIQGLAQDLHDLRANKISPREAHARAELARQILRGVHYVMNARKFIDQNLKPVEIEDGSKAKGRR